MKPLRASLLLLVSATTLFHLADSSVVSNTQACTNGNCAQAGSGGGSDEWPEWMRNGGSPPGIPDKRAAYGGGPIIQSSNTACSNGNCAQAGNGGSDDFPEWMRNGGSIPGMPDKRAARGVHIENRNISGSNGFPEMKPIMDMPKMDLPKFDNNGNSGNQAVSSISNGHNNAQTSSHTSNNVVSSNSHNSVSVERIRPHTHTAHSSSSNDDSQGPNYKIDSVNGAVEAAKEKVAKAFAESAKSEKPFGDDEASAPSNDDFIENVIKHRKPIQIERRPIIESSNTACSGSNCVSGGNGNNGGVAFPPMPLMPGNQASSNVQVSNKPISIVQSSSSNADSGKRASSGRRPNADFRLLPPMETPEWLKTRGARSASNGVYV